MNVVLDNLPLFGDGIIRTLSICAFGAIGAFLLGAFVATLRVSPVPILRGFGTGWVQIMQNCPLAVVLFLIAFGLPEIGLRGSYFWFGVTGLALYTSAFVCESIRSGINSVALGQMEAARALGMSFGMNLRLVILPQAVRVTVPPLANTTIAMIKDSAIVGAIGVGGDLFSVADTLAASRGLAVVPVLLGVTVGYLLIILPTSFVFKRVENRMVVAA
ncbi:amino acid ABC transporter permease [Microtetraspora malaysiensis]|uniref:amino acid ABC transporter permease n=1 Tax=Microtetraspora malaysiensis TaxID=161358 RepID=UPI003D8E9D19